MRNNVTRDIRMWNKQVCVCYLLLNLLFLALVIDTLVHTKCTVTVWSNAIYVDAMTAGIKVHITQDFSGPFDTAIQRYGQIQVN